MNTGFTTLKQRADIQDFIQLELLKRGFQAPINKFEEVEGRGGSRFEFSTENFQTTPVIFESINISNFSSSIHEVEEHEESGVKFRKFWIQVNVTFKNFGGGTNGTNLFAVRGTLCKGEAFELRAS